MGSSPSTPRSINFFQVAAGEPLNGPRASAKNNAITGNPAAVNVEHHDPLAGPEPRRHGHLDDHRHRHAHRLARGRSPTSTRCVFNGPTLNFGSATGYLWLGHDLVDLRGEPDHGHATASCSSSNSADGRNTLYLLNTSTANSFTRRALSQRHLRVAFDTADSQLGAAGEKISFRGGTPTVHRRGLISLATGGTDRPAGDVRGRRRPHPRRGSRRHPDRAGPGQRAPSN